MKTSTPSRTPTAGAFALALLFILSATVPRALAATASPPERLSYQGFLADSDNNPLGPIDPENHTVVFRIYDASTGGVLMWSEQQVVTVAKGVFSVQLGEGSVTQNEPHGSLSSVFGGTDASDRYLELDVTDQGGRLAPRLRLLTSPYAFLAKNVADGAVDSSKLAEGSVGSSKIQGGAVTTAKLSIDSAFRVNDQAIYLRSGTDVNHFLKYASSYSGGFNPDGPVLQGFAGGILGVAAGGGSTALHWNSTGVGVHKHNPSEALDVVGNARVSGSVSATSVSARGASFVVATGEDTVVRMQNITRDWYIRNSVNGGTFGIFDGSVAAVHIVPGTTSWATGSDRRLKTEINQETGFLERVSRFRPVTYRLKSRGKDGRRELGFIAQDVQPEFPELVSESGDGMLALAYDRFGVIAIGAVRELNERTAARMNELEKENSALKQSLASVLERLQALESVVK